MATREEIMAALLALLQNCGDFVTVSRRNRSPEVLGPELSPAVFLLEAEEDYAEKSQTVPCVRTLNVSIVFYNDVGPNENAIPSTAINNALDQLDTLTQPDDDAFNTFTLGGLVKSARVKGKIIKAPGDVTGKSLAVVPFMIEIP